MDNEAAILVVRDSGQLTVDGMVIGAVKQNGEKPQLVLDLGWMAAAGIGIIVRGDPEVDHKRGGVVLER